MHRIRGRHAPGGWPLPATYAELAIGKHVAKSLLGCFDSACACAAFTCVLGKHCMQTEHFRSMFVWREAFPDAPPPPAASALALAAFFARAMAVFWALPPPMAPDFLALEARGVRATGGRS